MRASRGTPLAPFVASIFLSSVILLILGVFSSPLFVHADIPTHCVHQQVVGTWKLVVSKTMSREPGSMTIRCSSFVADREETLTLSNPNIALREANGRKDRGMWTMIYAEGFEARVSTQRYFAYLQYSREGVKAVSHCDRTFNGYIHNEDNSYACFRGIHVSNGQDSKSLPEVGQLVQDEFDYNLDVLQSSKDLSLIEESDEDLRSDLLLAMEESVNSNPDSTWVAKYNPKRSWNRYRDGSGGKWKDLRPSLESVRSKNRPQNLLNLVSMNPLPKSFDWRNMNGINYVSPVRFQGDCGSCYVFAALAMLEARVRIQSQNRVKLRLSPRAVLSQNPYGQECKGGWPFLASKYLFEFGGVDESCCPYNSESVHPCPSNCNRIRVRVKDYHYVGGYYGAATEQNMMEEIHQNGPIAVCFEAGPDLGMYFGGVFETSSTRKNGDRWWQPANHAVLIVGWGEDPSAGPYWIVKNSWGRSFGEEGYFRIKRGTDEANIESIPVAAIPEIVS